MLCVPRRSRLSRLQLQSQWRRLRRWWAQQRRAGLRGCPRHCCGGHRNNPNHLSRYCRRGRQRSPTLVVVAGARRDSSGSSVGFEVSRVLASGRRGARRRDLCGSRGGRRRIRGRRRRTKGGGRGRHSRSRRRCCRARRLRCRGRRRKRRGRGVMRRSHRRRQGSRGGPDRDAARRPHCWKHAGRGARRSRRLLHAGRRARRRAGRRARGPLDQHRCCRCAPAKPKRRALEPPRPRVAARVLRLGLVAAQRLGGWESCQSQSAREAKGGMDSGEAGGG